MPGERAEPIREVLVTRAAELRKLARQVRVLAQVSGSGLAASEGELWLRQRRLVQPAFAAAQMEHHAGGGPA